MPGGDPESGTTTEPTENVRMLSKAKLALQTLQQYARDAASEVAYLPRLLADKGKSNAGHAILGLLQYAGFEISANGKMLTWRADCTRRLQYRRTVAENTIRPAAARQTVMARIEDSDGNHDANAPAAGMRAAQAAAEAARPPAVPEALELVRPESGERIGRVGTGWGNVPRAISEHCVAEQKCLDDLIVRVEQFLPR